MNIAFFGSPEIAKGILKSIHTEFPVSLVVTQPDKPVGRKKEITPTPVKQYALENNIPVETPDSLTDFQLKNIDLAIVVAYGLIIPQSVLDQSKFGFINVHYSLLPKYRGASPVQEAILHNEKTTGVTIMKMDAELDHGEIITQKEVAIDINDTTESLLKKLTETSKALLSDIIEHIENNNSLPPLTKQQHEEATFCGRISKQDAFIEYIEIQEALSNPEKAIGLHNKIRAYYPWPNVWTILPDEKRCKIISSHLSSPTSIRDLKDSRVRGNDTGFQITQIQIEGKQRTRDRNIINRTLTN